MALTRWLAITAAAVALGACPEPAALVAGAELDPSARDFGAVEVTGLGSGWRSALRRLDQARWSEVLSVRAVTPGDTAPVPLLAGAIRITGAGLRFEPRYRPAGALELLVRVDRSLLGTDAGSVKEWRFRLPAPAAPPSTTVLQSVYPASPVVPANQLRWYLQFSAPMREGEVAHRVHLVDDQGREVRQAFLDTPQELWDPSRRRLTLLFDPGRVKRGIRTRLELGPPIESGREYILRVDAAWPDDRGAPLSRSLEHRFRVGPPDRVPPPPARWRLIAPPVASREALEVWFGEALDHALAEHLLAVSGPDGAPVPGRVTLAADERWSFTPDTPWTPGHYRLQVHPDLEDLAGNSVRRIFDADLSRGQRATAESGPVNLEFEPRAAEPVPAPAP